MGGGGGGEGEYGRGRGRGGRIWEGEGEGRENMGGGGGGEGEYGRGRGRGGRIWEGEKNDTKSRYKSRNKTSVQFSRRESEQEATPTHLRLAASGCSRWWFSSFSSPSLRRAMATLQKPWGKEESNGHTAETLG